MKTIKFFLLSLLTLPLMAFALIDGKYRASYFADQLVTVMKKPKLIMMQEQLSEPQQTYSHSIETGKYHLVKADNTLDENIYITVIGSRSFVLEKQDGGVTYTAHYRKLRD